MVVASMKHRVQRIYRVLRGDAVSLMGRTTYGKGDTIMGSVALGTKHICKDCGTRFYDLQKPEAICPKCGCNMTNHYKAESYEGLASEPVADTLMKKTSTFTFNDHDAESPTDPKHTIEAMDEDSDDDIHSLSELDNRDTHGKAHVGHDDDVEESQLMDDMPEYDTILDKADMSNDDELRA